MKERDHLIKIMDQGKNVRLYLAGTTALVEEARRRHGTSATASAALGRAMTAALMMASDLKGEEDILTLRINGDGPLGTILVTADSRGGVRGLVSNPRADLPATPSGKLAVGELVGKNGYLEVIKDLGLKQPFTGRVPLVSGEIAEDIAEYYMTSEQIPSLVSLGVLVNTDLSIQAAGGLLVQALPEANDEVLGNIEKNILAMGSISSRIDSCQKLEDILVPIMQGLEYRIIGRQELDFRCNCSRERLLDVISGFSREENRDAQENEDIEAECNFCHERYRYTADEIEDIKNREP